MKRNAQDIHHVLVIDDDPDDYLFVKDAIKQFNPAIDVYYLDRCEDAYRFKNHPIDLVLLDINMPAHDGFEWLKGIRDNGYVDLPVIMYTNSLSPAHIRKAYEEGANLYFVKPDNFNHLKQGLSALVNLDWSDPFLIKEKYSKGNYKTFQYT